MTRSTPSPARRALAGLAAACLATVPGPARAQQSCSPETRVPFAGHAFPVDAAPRLIDAFRYVSFAEPVLVTPVPGGPDRLAVGQKGGQVLVLPNDPFAFSADVLVDLSQTGASWAPILEDGEQGLLGLAFDPDFATNGHFYVAYSVSAAACRTAVACTRVVRLNAIASAGGEDGDGEEILSVDPASALTVMQLEEPAVNHKAAFLAFGPDGMLWISTGDGGGTNDPAGNAQNLNSFFGKLLRIDVSHTAPYTVPDDNPFVGQPFVRSEIFAYGLHAPRRFSFDGLTGDLWLGDAGETSQDEVDRIPFALVGGENFGWRLCEGTTDANGHGCPTPGLTAPLLSFARTGSDAQGVIGGPVYRGSSVTDLYGEYVYADSASGRIFSWLPGGGAPVQLATLPGVTAIGEDRAGELLLVNGADGHIRRVVAAGSELDPAVPQSVSATGLFASVVPLAPAPGLLAYDVNVPGWSSSAATRRWLALPGDERIGFSALGAWTLPVGTALVEQLDLPNTNGFTHAETRVLVRQANGWRGYTYWWSPDQRNGILITGSLLYNYNVDLGSGPEVLGWYFPLPSECLECHSQVAGRALGLRTRQMNRAGANGENQLERFACLGLFDAPVEPASSYEHFPQPGDAATLDAHVRASLDVNCASCHSPGAPVPGGMDLRFDTPPDATNTLFVAATAGDLGVPGGVRIHPGHPERSVLVARMQTTSFGVVMPPFSVLPDLDGAALVSEWIARAIPGRDPDGDGIDVSEDNCPTLANADQLDGDGDGVGDVCDNCVEIPNPRAPEGWLDAHSWSTLSGGQRDDDGDGYGNRCDAKFAPNKNVGLPDLAAMLNSLGQPVGADTCGKHGGKGCGSYDVDETGDVIDQGDVDALRALFGTRPGPKCAACPIDCTGPACAGQ